MNGKIPELCEPLDYFRNWKIFENVLEKFRKVKFYYEDFFKIWISENKNPLEIPIILDLFKNKLDRYEERLGNLEAKLGKENLSFYFNELTGQSKPEQIIQKINSLDYETFVYIELKKKYEQINKINKTGDWEVDAKIVSVKSIMDLDFNYQLISNLINSMLYIKEYKIIRKYDSIRIAKGKKINYKFRELVLEFLRNNLILILEKYDSVDLKIPYLSEKINVFSNDFTVSIIYSNENSKKEIEIFFSYKNIVESEISIDFKISSFSNIFYGINFDTNFFWIDEKNSNALKIIHKAGDIIEEFDKNFDKANKPFEGWIILSRHPKDQEYFLKNEKEFIEKLKKQRKSNNYKVFLYVVPQWNFDNEVVKKIEI